MSLFLLLLIQQTPLLAQAFSIDKMPEFPGGKNAMAKFVAENIKYPEEARKAGVEGIVTISYLVGEDGSLSSFETIKSPRPDMAEEAIRVLKLMPKFSPGMKYEKAVPVRLVLPVKFVL
jgi:periplasmic protein TonB